MPTGVADLTGLVLDEVPACCARCGWWQARTSGRSPDRAHWVADVEEEFGVWGKVYRDDSGVVALLQYAPGEFFPRAWRIPAGPPSPGVVIATCAYLVPPTGRWALQSLLLAAIGELRDRRVGLFEAFAIAADGPGPIAHPLLPHDLLTELGFRVVRSRGGIDLMQLPLRTVLLDEVPDAPLARAWAAVRNRRRRAVYPA